MNKIRNIKIDPMVVLELAKLAGEVIKTRADRKLLEERGKTFIEALKEHEKTVRMSIETHEKETIALIEALRSIAENASNDSDKKEALKLLVEIGLKALDTLKETSESTLKTLPHSPTRKLLAPENDTE